MTHYKFSDDVFERDFALCNFDEKLFSHEAHIRLAWIHISKYGIQLAEANIQEQIQNFVGHVGAEDKYHTTLTVVAIRVVHHFMQKSISDSFQSFISEFPQLINNFKSLINSHYSFDIYKSEKARITFIEPDLIPL